MYKLTDVSMVYGETTVLEHVDLSIPINGMTAIMGPSGSGKSTLLRLMSFLEAPAGGHMTLELNGSSFDSREEKRPWPTVTTVFQRQFLWPHITLEENIALPLRMRGDTGPMIDARVQEVLQLLDMTSFSKRYPNQVSGGQAQRGALARALALDPSVVLLDEPHAGLDLAQQQVLNGHLRFLRHRGVAVIVATHSVEFARKHADRIVVVEERRIDHVAALEPDDVQASPYLRAALELV